MEFEPSWKLTLDSLQRNIHVDKLASISTKMLSSVPDLNGIRNKILKSTYNELSHNPGTFPPPEVHRHHCR